MTHVTSNDEIKIVSVPQQCVMAHTSSNSEIILSVPQQCLMAHVTSNNETYLYADDDVILGRSEGYIKGTLEEMAATTHQICLTDE
jgi:hypothetical protein